MRFALVPGDDPAQRVRFERLAISACMYLLYAVPLVAAVWLGYCPPHVALIWATASTIGLIGFYSLFRTNFNRKFRDPSLTIEQMSLAVSVVLYTQIHAGPLRGAFLFGLLIIFVFGSFKLKLRQLLVMSLVTSAVYAATLPLIAQAEGARFQLAEELVLWFTLSSFLSFLSVVAGIISRMRHDLAAGKTRLQELLDHVTELATHDELTRTYNRRCVREMVQHEKNRADRESGVFCVVLLDIDHFKNVNDTYGHAVGDAVLKAFADTVAGQLRKSDLLGRYGGEEFLLCLPGASLATVEHCTGRIRSTLALTVFEGLPPDKRITFSAGIARYMQQETVDALIDRADRALYMAKRSGRDRSGFG